MSIYDTLEKRHHVLEYKEKNIDNKLLDELLWCAWKISPSKNNFMPYTVNVLGPNKQAEKNKIYAKVTQNHKFYDDIGASKDTIANPKMISEYKFKPNMSYSHVLKNSHLIVFSSRVCAEPNPFYKRAVALEGHYAEQCELDQIIATAESTSFEVGLFASNLTALCIENGIDVSFTACLPKSIDKWTDTPYLWYDEVNQTAKIHVIMSLGYAQRYRYEWLKEKGVQALDIKPEKDLVVKWQ